MTLYLASTEKLPNIQHLPDETPQATRLLMGCAAVNFLSTDSFNALLIRVKISHRVQLTDFK